VHPQRDLALARLKTPIVSVSSVALSGSAPAAGDELVLAGFGRTASDWNAGKLRSAKFKVDAPQASSFDVVATGSDTVGLCKGDGKVDVVINNRKGPCKPPNGCQALVPTILKPGQEMHVWYPNAVDPVVLKGRSTVP